MIVCSGIVVDDLEEDGKRKEKALEDIQGLLILYSKKSTIPAHPPTKALWYNHLHFHLF
jgi:hypothetical protein